MTYADRLEAKDWTVQRIDHAPAREFIERWHYARGCSQTRVYTFGLHHHALADQLFGVTMWLPPTKNAAISVDREQWRQVLALSRMAVHPSVPKNACSFMLARSVRAIKRERRFVALVTYADESQGHEGGVYRAAGWTYAGRTKQAMPRWVDPKTGRQVATQATRTRTPEQMAALGYVNTGSFHKHKFILRLQ